MAGSSKDRRRGASGAPPLIRRGATPVRLFNSGLEVWLYDAANRAAIRASGAFDLNVPDPADRLGELARDGVLVGYGLYQDDAVNAAIIVGEPLTERELAVAPWLDPQRAFLRLPSGRLCVESNDASRLGPEAPSESGAEIDVPPGDYRLTLHRVDREALRRDGREWAGPAEVLVLTPGGSPADHASGILEIAPRRDRAWVGAYRITGTRLEGLAWFPDAWDTFVLNLDRGAAQQLGLVPGHYLRTTVPGVGLELVTVFAPSWQEGARFQPPEGTEPDEYGFAALSPMGDWDGAEALFCRRHRTKRGVDPAHHYLWLPATVQVLDVPLATAPARVRGPLLLDAAKRAYWKADIRARRYYDDPQFLTARLMFRVDGVAWGGALALQEAVDLVDAGLAPLSLEPLGDFSFDVQTPGGPKEYTNRLYAGLADTVAAVWTTEGAFEIFYFTEFEDGTWALTGTVTEAVARALTAVRPRLSVRAGKGKLGVVLEQHRTHVGELGRPTRSAPESLEAGVERYEAYLVAALD